MAQWFSAASFHGRWRRKCWGLLDHGLTPSGDFTTLVKFHSLYMSHFSSRSRSYSLRNPWKCKKKTTHVATLKKVGKQFLKLHLCPDLCQNGMGSLLANVGRKLIYSFLCNPADIQRAMKTNPTGRSWWMAPPRSTVIVTQFDGAAHWFVFLTTKTVRGTEARDPGCTTQSRYYVIEGDLFCTFINIFIVKCHKVTDRCPRTKALFHLVLRRVMNEQLHYF